MCIDVLERKEEEVEEDMTRKHLKSIVSNTPVSERKGDMKNHHEEAEK